MMGTTHMLTAFTIVATGARMGILPAEIYYYVPAVIGGVLPDIDHANSWIAHKVSITIKIPLPFGLGRSIFKKGFIPIELNPIYWCLSMFTEHRKQTHSLGAVILLAALSILVVMPFIQYLPMAFFINFLIGYLSHIGMDMLTKEGASIFWPLDAKKYSLLPFTTGGIGETLIDLALFAWLGVLYSPQIIEAFNRIHF